MKPAITALSTAMSLLAFAAPQSASALGASKCGPGSISVISGEEIANSHGSDVADALRDAPGVSFERGRALTFNNNDNTITIRGLRNGSKQTLVVIDGQRLTDESLAARNGALPNQDQIENVQVLRGAAASAIYGYAGANGAVIITTRKHARTGFATEQAGALVNPANGFEFDLRGHGFDATLGACLDVGTVLPVDISLNLQTFSLSGSDSHKNLQFLEGFGVTGIGGLPGVFVAAPTDIRDTSIEVDRQGSRVSLDLELPLFFSGQNTMTSPFRGPSFGATSLLLGLRGGTLFQDEKTRFSADTPAFGAGSAWEGAYDTEFDGQYKGAYLGARTTRTFFARNGSATTIGLSGTLGVDAYDFDVTEKVDATGLGGLLNYTNKQTHGFSENLVSGRLSGSINWRRGNFEIGAAVDIDTGLVPEIDRKLPDSNAFGALDPEYGLSSEPATSVQFRLGGLFRF